MCVCVCACACQCVRVWVCMGLCEIESERRKSRKMRLSSEEERNASKVGGVYKNEFKLKRKEMKIKKIVIGERQR